MVAARDMRLFNFTLANGVLHDAGRNRRAETCSTSEAGVPVYKIFGRKEDRGDRALQRLSFDRFCTVSQGRIVVARHIAWTADTSYALYQQRWSAEDRYGRFRVT